MLTTGVGGHVMAGEAGVARSRFWRRAIAFFVDGFAIGILLGAMGLALFEPTNGAIRVSSVPLSVRNCYPLNSLPAGVRLPPDFKVTHAARCTFAFLGFVYNRVVVLSEITRSGAGIFTRTIWFAIDSDGQPMRAF